MSIAKPKLEYTTNYALFNFNELNRPLRKDITKLVASMRKHGFRPSNPLHVVTGRNGLFDIKRGHHRFTAAKTAEVGVWYIVDNDPMAIHEWEGDSNSRWSIADFASSYAATGKPGSEDYQALLKYAADYGIGLGMAMILLSGANKHNQVRAGTFRIADMAHAQRVAVTMVQCRDAGVTFADSSGFLGALSMVMRVPGFDPAVFVNRVILHPKVMSRRGRAKDYLQEIELVYNHGARGKRLPLVLLAQGIARERQRTFGRSSTPEGDVPPPNTQPGGAVPPPNTQPGGAVPPPDTQPGTSAA